MPQASSAAAALSSSRARSRSTPYVGAASSSSAAAAAPADRPDAPTDQRRRGPIPSRIKNQEVLEELKRAKDNGVLQGAGLAAYNELDQRRQTLIDQGIYTISPSRYKEYKAIFTKYVFDVKPPEAS